MLIEKVFGMTQTAISLSDRFTMLGPMRRPATVTRRRPDSRLLMETAAQAKLLANRRALRQRIGVFRGRGNRGGGGGGGMRAWGGGGGGSVGGGSGSLRRWGSEGSLFMAVPVRRSNSAMSFMQPMRRNSISNSFISLSRAGSYGNLSQASGRSRGRGGGRGRGARALLRQLQYQDVRLRPLTRSMMNGGMMNGMARRGAGGARGRGRGRGTVRGRGRGLMRGRGQGAGAAPGRPGMRRYEVKPIPSKEELDLQIDQYMAGTKSALDKELDEYNEMREPF